MIEQYNNIYVLRDDLLVGGTKSLLMEQLDKDVKEYIYVSPVYGQLQIALTDWCVRNGIKSTIICAKRKIHHPNTKEVIRLGGNVIEIPYGYMQNLKIYAKKYLEKNDCKEVPFGLDTEESRDIIANRMRSLGKFDEVWCAIGSGVLVEGILRGTTNELVNGVVVGKDYDNTHLRLKIWKYHKPFDRLAKMPPFPSSRNYDAKAWEYCVDNQTDKKILFWNVK